MEDTAYLRDRVSKLRISEKKTKFYLSFSLRLISLIDEIVSVSMDGELGA